VRLSNLNVILILNEDIPNLIFVSQIRKTDDSFIPMSLKAVVFLDIWEWQRYRKLQTGNLIIHSPIKTDPCRQFKTENLTIQQDLLL